MLKESAVQGGRAETAPARAGIDVAYQGGIPPQHDTSSIPKGRREVACALRPDMAAGQRGAFGGDHGNQMIPDTPLSLPRR